MQSRVQDIRRQFDRDLARVKDAASLEDVRTRYLGRRAGLVTALLRELRETPPEKRAASGKAVNELKTHVEAALEGARTTVGAAGPAPETIDLTLPGRSQRPGSSHPITQVRALIEEIFLEMG